MVPPEIIQRILTFLCKDFQSLVLIESVCQSWRSVLRDPGTWNLLYFVRWSGQIPTWEGTHPIAEHHKVRRSDVPVENAPNFQHAFVRLKTRKDFIERAFGSNLTSSDEQQFDFSELFGKRVSQVELLRCGWVLLSVAGRSILADLGHGLGCGFSSLHLVCCARGTWSLHLADASAPLLAITRAGITDHVAVYEPGSLFAASPSAPGPSGGSSNPRTAEPIHVFADGTRAARVTAVAVGFGCLATITSTAPSCGGDALQSRAARAAAYRVRVRRLSAAAGAGAPAAVDAVDHRGSGLALISACCLPCGRVAAGSAAGDVLLVDPPGAPGGGCAARLIAGAGAGIRGRVERLYAAPSGAILVLDRRHEVCATLLRWRQARAGATPAPAASAGEWVAQPLRTLLCGCGGGGGGGGGEIVAAAPYESALAVVRRDGLVCLVPDEVGPGGGGGGGDGGGGGGNGGSNGGRSPAARVLHRERDRPVGAGALAALAGGGGLATCAVCAGGRIRVRAYTPLPVG